MLEPHPDRVVANTQGRGQFGQRGVGVLFDVRLQFGRIEFAPGSPTRFRSQGVRFGGGKVAIDRALAQLEAPRGFRPGAARLHKLHHPLPQIQRVGFHAPHATSHTANVNVKRYTINCNGGRAESGLSSARRKTAFALKSNVLLLLERYGLERMGFLTLTFARHVVDYRKAQTAPHSLMSGVLKRRHPEYIIVLERMDSQRVHYHLLLVVAEDIRTGLNFAAVQAGDDRSASAFSSARNK